MAIIAVIDVAAADVVAIVVVVMEVDGDVGHVMYDELAVTSVTRCAEFKLT